MKFTITFKTPDVLTELEYEIKNKNDLEKAKKFARKFLRYDEYVDIEFDTENNSATVIRQSNERISTVES